MTEFELMKVDLKHAEKLCIKSREINTTNNNQNVYFMLKDELNEVEELMKRKYEIGDLGDEDIDLISLHLS
jgi:hypothetical protein